MTSSAREFEQWWNSHSETLGKKEFIECWNAAVASERLGVTLEKVKIFEDIQDFAESIRKFCQNGQRETAYHMIKTRDAELRSECAAAAYECGKRDALKAIEIGYDEWEKGNCHDPGCGCLKEYIKTAMQDRGREAEAEAPPTDVQGKPEERR